MRVAMVGPYPLPGAPPTGGIEAVAVALVGGLREIGLELTIVTCTSQVTSEQRVEDDGISLCLIPYGDLRGCSLPYVSEHRAISRTLKEMAPDIVHVQGQNHLAPAAIAAGLPTVVTLHGISYREQHISDPTASWTARVRARAAKKLYARFERITLARARDLVIISPYVLESVRHMTAARTHLIPNPIDEVFYSIPRDPIPGRILFIGVVSPRKNVLVLARAFEEVLRRRPDSTLHIVGRPADDSYLAALRSTLQDRGLSRAARYLGVVSDEEIRRQYSEATILALPSKEESSPMVVQQAQAMGLPVVASRAAGIPFLVEEGITGLLATPDDESEFAAKLITALGDQPMLDRMAAASIANAERFRIASVADATLELYETVIQRGAPIISAR